MGWAVGTVTGLGKGAEPQMGTGWGSGLRRGIRTVYSNEVGGRGKGDERGLGREALCSCPFGCDGVKPQSCSAGTWTMILRGRQEPLAEPQSPVRM